MICCVAAEEELVKFDGTPLFPERKAYTVNYPLSDIEAALYEAVTEYVQKEMGKADELEGPRRGSVGFALTALQRRLASSPEAIYQSLRRRKERLESRLREEKLGIRGRRALAETLDVPEDDDLNASVKVPVEIAADFPLGASDQTKRAVSENARSLGLKAADWE